MKLIYGLMIFFSLSGNRPERPVQPPDTIAETVSGRDEGRIVLDEVTVRADRAGNIRMMSAQNVVRVDRSFLDDHFSGSLMQSLEHIPGVRAVSISAGQSRPSIRGMGFHRMVVTENGIRHEGQQWGEDHGLEIDRFSVDEATVVKGPASLLHGPEAIGGVILLRNSYIPATRAEGSFRVYGGSAGRPAGLSGRAGGRTGRWYYVMSVTCTDYADGRVPADSIQYYSYYIRLKGGRLRNTAGRERNAGFVLGFEKEDFHSRLLISGVYSQTGFFADAHGLEVRLSDIDYDSSSRDIDLPRHTVSHFKLINNTVRRFGRVSWETNIAFQKNLRKEFSEPVSHGYMPVPPDTQERLFDKETFSATTLIGMPVRERISLQAGLSAEHQVNRRGGWGFVIPDFRTTGAGVFVHGRIHVSDDLIISAGVRADRLRTHIRSYRDWYATPDEDGLPVYRERATALQKAFRSITWSAGLNRRYGPWTLNVNIGKSFRAPAPKELGADGVNYHIFRYEKGDSGLKAEESFQLDAGFGWQNGVLTVRWEPFINYFPNYIYMNPTPEYLEGLQMYRHAQAGVIRFGFESDFRLQLTRRLSLGMQSEYLYAEQLSGDRRGYTLPFSPPPAAGFGIEYRPGRGLWGESGDILLEYRVTGSQHRIVPPEERTEGYQLLNLSLGCSRRMRGFGMNLRLQAHNLLNRRYYDHTGFYRLIDVPEPGRNISALLGLSF
ncbi:MAG: TonB-dependent receptor [Proteiniphilum sp.]|nr:TonB-dependent receptor [Proteiniphilum sp.]